jgi:thiamine kinase-like enzyme
MPDLGEIVEQLERELGPADGAPEPLEGGITNRNFRVRFGGRECVLRLPGRDTALLGIDREAERLASSIAAELGIAPALVTAGEGYLVTEYLDAAPMEPDRLRSAPESAARALRSFHDSGLELPTRFWVPELLDEYARIVAERGGTLPERYDDVRALAGRIADALPLGQARPCHNDLLPSNVLALHRAPGDALLVDWEYAGMGQPMFDLGNLAVNNELDGAGEERLLAAYFGDPPDDRRRAALALMRLMSDAREGAWGVVQGVLSELDFDFGDYAEQHFGRLESAASDPRLEEWLDAAAA